MLLFHRRFVSCDIDGECVKEATASPVLVLENQALNPDSDIEVFECSVLGV